MKANAPLLNDVTVMTTLCTALGYTIVMMNRRNKGLDYMAAQVAASVLCSNPAGFTCPPVIKLWHNSLLYSEAALLKHTPPDHLKGSRAIGEMTAAITPAREYMEQAYDVQGTSDGDRKLQYSDADEETLKAILTLCEGIRCDVEDPEALTHFARRFMFILLHPDKDTARADAVDLLRQFAEHKVEQLITMGDASPILCEDCKSEINEIRSAMEQLSCLTR